MNDQSDTWGRAVWSNKPDDFGVPLNFFGAHDEEFFGALGRVAALSALIAHQALGVFQTMTNSLQGEHTQLPAGQLVEKACKTLRPVDNDEKQALLSYFEDVGGALRDRNDYIHNLWPAQSGNRLYGWRHGRNKNAPAHEQFETLETTMADLKVFIRTLVELVQRHDHAQSAATALQQLKLRAGEEE